MPTPAEIISTMVSPLQNDTAQQEYTNEAVLPYFNMALRDLQEQFELNNIPVTNETSAIINIPAGTVSISFVGSPQLPTDLIEIQQLWESQEGAEQYTPMKKREFLPRYLEGSTSNKLMFWAWMSNEIRFLASNQDNDIKIDYIKSLFNTIVIADINVELGTKYKNVFSYLGYKTAALCSMFIGENESRATVLAAQANSALETSMGISVKGGQAIGVKRRPYRQAYKRRGII